MTRMGWHMAGGTYAANEVRCSSVLPPPPSLPFPVPSLVLMGVSSPLPSSPSSRSPLPSRPFSAPRSSSLGSSGPSSPASAPPTSSSVRRWPSAQTCSQSRRWPSSRASATTCHLSPPPRPSGSSASRAASPGGTPTGSCLMSPSRLRASVRYSEGSCGAWTAHRMLRRAHQNAKETRRRRTHAHAEHM